MCSTSGAEWWTQVIDSRDDIGFHWDRDYGTFSQAAMKTSAFKVIAYYRYPGLEEEEGVHVYPLFATVTYLSKTGGPTIVCDRMGTPRSTNDASGPIKEVSISHPLPGKHIKFDGRLLHGAPSSVYDIDETDADSSTSGNSSGCESESDSSTGGEEDDNRVMRVTFLVNIWVNHIPSQSVRLPLESLVKMSPFQSDDVIFRFPDLTMNSKLQRKELLHITSGTNAQPVSWKFTNGSDKFIVRFLVPPQVRAEEIEPTSVGARSALTTEVDGVEEALEYRADNLCIQFSEEMESCCVLERYSSAEKRRPTQASHESDEKSGKDADASAQQKSSTSASSSSVSNVVGNSAEGLLQGNIDECDIHKQKRTRLA